MKKKILAVICIVLALVIGMTIGLAASGQLQKITAYLNYGITVKYDGDVQKMFDANGKRVYPISYEGTTYVPIRAVSNMMGVDVEWDGPNNTVWLGQTGDYKDFIETVQPYSVNQNDEGGHYTIANNKTVNIGGKTYSNFIKMLDYSSKDIELFYNLEGKYTELSFLIYSSEDDTLRIFGDNDELLLDKSITGDRLPERVTVDVKGVQQMTIINNFRHGDWAIYIVDAKIK